MGLDDNAIRDLEQRAYESFDATGAGGAEGGGGTKRKPPRRWPPRLLAVRRRWGGFPAVESLRDGDVVLSVDGEPVHTFRDVELACQRKPPPPAAMVEATGGSSSSSTSGGGAQKPSPYSSSSYSSLSSSSTTTTTTTSSSSSSSSSSSKAKAKEEGQSVVVELLRDGRRQQVRVGTVALESDETRKVLLWGGAALQVPPAAVARQRGVACEGVYVASLSPGSPANLYQLSPTSRIVEVDGKPTPSLEAFLAVVRAKRHGESVRIRQEDLRGASSVSTLKLDLKYWPTYEITKEDTASSSSGVASRYTWHRRLVTPDDDADATAAGAGAGGSVLVK